MVLTRATPRFAQLASLVEMELALSGAPVLPGLIDAALNAQVENVAARIGVEPWRALDYAPDDLGTMTADALVEVMLEDLGPTDDR
ncbi:hypothetical protein [Isoptericola sp. NPDC055881]